MEDKETAENIYRSLVRTAMIRLRPIFRTTDIFQLTSTRITCKSIIYGSKQADQYSCDYKLQVLKIAYNRLRPYLMARREWRLRLDFNNGPYILEKEEEDGEV